MVIKSKQNDKIKEINKLKQKKYRLETGKYIAEGKKIVNEAIKFKKEDISDILVSTSYAKKNNVNEKYIIIEDEVFEYITEDKNPEGILAIINFPEKKEIDYTNNEIVILDEIRDPGNMGTILRTLDAVGKKQVILTGDIVDPYMPKVVRSSMGSIFRLNIKFGNLNEEMQKLKQNGYKIAAADMSGENIYKLEKDKYALIFSNEANGLKENILPLLDKKISIPMEGNAESLNVAVSVGVVMYEFYRKNKFF